MSDTSPPAALVQPAPPPIDADTAARIARDGWGVDATARTLGSHQDRNFALERPGSPTLLLKIANPSVTAAELEAQSAAAARIAERTGLRAPRALPTADGATTRPVTVAGVTMHARVLEFLEGDTLSGYLSPEVCRRLGRMAAQVAHALADVDAPAAEREHQWDLRHAPAVLDGLLPHLADAARRDHLAHTARQAWDAVSVVADELPVQFIHGDLTDDNVVTADPVGRVPDGVIDLGDLNRTWTVGELAITVSSVLHHPGAGWTSAAEVIRAYDRERPLTDAESRALWPLVVVRAVTLVASAHHVLGTDPGNAYAAENLAHEQAILDHATALPLDVATAFVRHAVGHAVDEPSLPAGERMLDADVVTVDLSATSPGFDAAFRIGLQAGARWLAASVEEDLFTGALRATGGGVAARFGEARLSRSRPGDPDEPVNVALGVQVRFAEPTALRAPWAGEVVRTESGLRLRGADVDLVLVLDLDGDGDGDDTSQARRVEPGDTLATASGAVWIQAVRPGATVPRFVPHSLAVAWRSVVADPSPLIPGLAAAPAVPDARALQRRRDAAIADVQEHYYDDPPVMVRGWREHLIDADGRIYLDTLNNVTSVGHAHPRLVDAVSRQWSLLNTNSRFHYPGIVEFSERLAALLPAPLDTVFLVNSGSEAVDLALRLGQVWSGRTDVLAVREAYHGWTYLTDAVSTSIADNPAALETRPAWVHTVAAPHPYRGEHADDPAAYARDAVAEVERLAAAGTPVGAFVAESIFGNAGGVFLPDGYLDAVYSAVRAHGGLAIADEVQVGYGRLGEWFWGFQQQGVVPDVVAVAKAMGNGHPLGAVITTREIAARYRDGGYFFSSAGGSPVSCAAGLAVLDIIRDERLDDNARRVGGRLRERLLELGRRHPILAAVHGAGFYLGPEFVRDRETWEPATAETAAICRRLRELGVIAQPTGDHQNILKIKPPMCFDDDSADLLVAALERVLSEGW
ncbi:aminotransferase [Microbacterium aureliae]